MLTIIQFIDEISISNLLTFLYFGIFSAKKKNEDDTEQAVDKEG